VRHNYICEGEILNSSIKKKMKNIFLSGFSFGFKKMTKTLNKLKTKIARQWRVFYLSIKHCRVNLEISLKRRSSNTIVICVNGWVPHGAWTDRLKGIISAFDYAKSNGFEFKIWYDSPAELSQVLLPNGKDWYADNNSEKFNPLFDKVIYLIDNEDGLSSLNLLKSSKKKYFLYLNTDSLKDKNNWRSIFNTLFVFDENIKQTFNENLHEDYLNVAFVFRFIDTFGDYTIRGRKPSDIDKEKLASDYLQKFGVYFRSISNPEKKTRYYIFSDSDFFTIRLKSMFPDFIVLHDSKRKFITNAGLTKETSVNVLKRTASDFYLLSKCNRINHFVDDKYLYESGFPLHASYLSDSSNYRKILL
jgi:hypothetical protein